MLIAKDGTECSIDDSAAPIHDDEGKLSGVVLVFRDITQRRQAERDIAEAKAFAESIVDTVREPLVVLDADLRVQSANRSFYQTFQVTPEETTGRLIYELGNGQWDIPALRELLEKILPQNTAFNDFEVEHEFPAIGRKTMLLNARRVHREGDRTELILLAIEDITERKQAEEARREAETRYTSLVRNIKDHCHLHDGRRREHHQLERGGRADHRLLRGGNPWSPFLHRLLARGHPAWFAGTGTPHRPRAGPCGG